MRLVKTAMVATMLALFVAPVAGQKGGGPKAQGPKGPSTTTRGPSTKATPAKSGAPKMAKASPGSGQTKPTNAKAPKSSKADVASSTTSSTGATSEATTTTSNTTADAINFTAGAVGEKLSKNSNLRSKLETRLDRLGYDGNVYQAAYGFRNLGQFVAATNVAENLGLPFEQLKLQMTGFAVDSEGIVTMANVGTNGAITMVDPDEVTSPAPTKSLGQAIQTAKSLDPVTAQQVAQSATTQADSEIQSTTVTQ
jgi:hypothetical protein